MIKPQKGARFTKRGVLQRSKLDKLVKSQKTPVFAGMTALETFYETIKLRLFAKSSNIKCQLSQFRNS